MRVPVIEVHGTEAAEHLVQAVHLGGIGKLGIFPDGLREDEGSVPANPDLRAGRHHGQILLQPGKLALGQAHHKAAVALHAVFAFALARRRLVVIQDIVQHHPVVVADIHGIIGRAEGFAPRLLGITGNIGMLFIGQARAVVVMVAHHTVHRGRKPIVAQEYAGLLRIHVVLIPVAVLDQIAQLEGNHGTFFAMLGIEALYQRNNGPAGHVKIVQLGAVLQVKVRGKNNRVLVLILLFQYEIVVLRHIGRLRQAGPEIRREPFPQRDRIAAGSNDEHKSLFLGALDGIGAVDIGPDNLHPVGYTNAGQRLAVTGYRAGKRLRPTGRRGHQTGRQNENKLLHINKLHIFIKHTRA